MSKKPFMDQVIADLGLLKTALLRLRQSIRAAASTACRDLTRKLADLRAGR